jgi:hypothetical protein
LSEARASAAFTFEVGKELAVGRHEGTGALDDESDFVIAVNLVDGEEDVGEVGR